MIWLLVIIAVSGYFGSGAIALIGIQEKRDALAGWGVAGLIAFGLMLGGLGEKLL